MSTKEESNQQPTEMTLEGMERAAAEQVAITSYDMIPEAILNGLKSYVEGYPVGGFLRAVISNDFLLAVGKADLWSMKALPAIACWIYQEMPSDAHGSKKVYEAWLSYCAGKRECLDDDKMLELKTRLTEARRESRQ